ncbi:MAG: phosphoribosylglycinamide formyltransferase, partial [Rhodobiaceae bacterium]|nr:phosphoribosylglycinamide formyltransferase [Rhodobiaceae bacterium]
RVAVLISGRGSNMAALIEAASAPGYPAEIALVISDKPDAAGLETARQARIRTSVFDRKQFAGRAAFEQAILATLDVENIDLVCLAGFMRVLSADFAAAWEGRMLNIHPSLLPSFKGLDTHERALAAGVKVSGCTVHFVSAELDAGPIVAQAVVPVLPGDDADSLAARVLTMEHRLYPHALALVASGKVRIANGVARLAPDVAIEAEGFTVPDA